MVRWLVVLGLVVPVAAAAQPGPSSAPDEPPPTTPVPPGQLAPPAQPLLPAHAGVMARRWAVAVTLGPTSVKADTGAAPRVEMTTLGLAGHYRVKPELELGAELVVGGGGGDTNDAFQLGGLLLDARLRFLAEQRWNAYALGSLGVMAIGDKAAPSNDKKGRGAIRVGAGVEHRWVAFAVDAEVFAFAVTKNPSVPDPIVVTTGYQLERFTVTGIAFVFGGSYYF